jgi:hypothetical protein
MGATKPYEVFVLPKFLVKKAMISCNEYIKEKI